ncbi:MAG TPA: hypothetical protein VN181_04460 [Thermoanaerobaculia bacterium]|nr:hypothetical protein [Thermoanaerobaculia bacterium]
MDDKVIRLRAGQTAVVGYGALLLRESIGSFIRLAYDRPFATCYVEGWRRCWNVGMPNAAFYFEQNAVRIYPEKIVYLNVRPADTLLNCVLFVLEASELEVLHRCEWIYYPVRVNDSLRHVRVHGGDAILYCGRPDFHVGPIRSPVEGGIRASYVKTIDAALDSIGALFRTDYEQSTDPVPQHLVIDDRFDPDRPNPWASVGLEYRPDDRVPSS